MAYAKSYLGDTLATGVVVQTIAAKTAIIPNVTVKGELAGKISANVVEFWYNLAPTVGDATAGADFNLTNVGVKKATLTLERALHIDEKIPQVAIETISAPIVADQTAKSSVALANALQAKFITDLLALAQAKTYTFGLGLLDAIVEGMATFELASSAKILGVMILLSQTRQMVFAQPQLFLVQSVKQNYYKIQDSSRYFKVLVIPHTLPFSVKCLV
jgi:hypothetical protein